MITKKIYLAGGMSDLTFEESNEWRLLCKEAFAKGNSDIDAILYNPNDYFNFQTKKHISEREIKEFDLNLVRNSNLIIVNFNAPRSIGTAQELAIARELKIPIVGLNEKNRKLHPWLIEDCARIFGDIDDMIDYVKVCYLI